MNDTHPLADLLQKYFAGQCTPEEEKKVREYLADPANEAGMEDLLQEKWGVFVSKEVNTERSSLTEQRYAGIHKRVAKRTMPIWYYAAASFLILAIPLYLFRMEIQDVIDPVKTITYATRSGQQLSVSLPDGSEVWLNASSTLSVPEEFRRGTRDIVLQGEAFFEVKRDEHKPFFVHAGNFYTKVLGTSFNVKAYHDNVISVAVATGKVAVGTEDSLQQQREELALLTPGYRAKYDRTVNTLRRDSIVVDQAMAWREGRLVFAEASLEEMMLTLQRWYGVSINVEAAQAVSCSFTTDYRKGIALRDILEALRITGKITYTIDGKKIMIRPQESCQ